jgi:hypothetical protein
MRAIPHGHEIPLGAYIGPSFILGTQNRTFGQNRLSVGSIVPERLPLMSSSQGKTMILEYTNGKRFFNFMNFG